MARRRVKWGGQATFTPQQTVTQANSVVTPYKAPAAPKAPAPRKPPAPPTPHLVDDSTAAAARAQLRFKVSQGLAGSTQESAYDKIDFQEALRRMTEQRPKDEQSTREQANRQGLFYSGQLGKRLDDLATDYARRQGDQQQSYDRREAARVAARRAIESGASIDDAAITAELADRQVAADSSAADAGALAPNPQDPAAASKGSKLTNNSAVKENGAKGVIRAQGLGGGVWKARLKSGALVKIRKTSGGHWQVFKKGKWRAF